MDVHRFPILLAATLAVAATALSAPADGAEQRSASGCSAALLALEVVVGGPYPPPALACARPARAPSLRETVWIPGGYAVDASGWQRWIPGHCVERDRAPACPGEYRVPAPRCRPGQCVPASRAVPPARFPERSGAWPRDDGRGRGPGEDRGPFHRR